MHSWYIRISAQAPTQLLTVMVVGALKLHWVGNDAQRAEWVVNQGIGAPCHAWSRPMPLHAGEDDAKPGAGAGVRWGAQRVKCVGGV
jgi:hypothetical protein